jgi:hypothetical protein
LCFRRLTMWYRQFVVDIGECFGFFRFIVKALYFSVA